MPSSNNNSNASQATSSVRFDDVLKQLGLTNPPYSLKEIIYVNNGNVNTNQDNQIFKIQKLENGRKRLLTDSELDALIGRGKPLNGIAVRAEGGIQIVKKREFFQKVAANLNVANGSGDNGGDGSWDGNSGSPGIVYNVTGFSGNDEEIVKKIVFAYTNLIKEIYEFEAYAWGV